MESLSFSGRISAWHDGQMAGFGTVTARLAISGGTVPQSNCTESPGISFVTLTKLPQFRQESPCLSGSHSIYPPQQRHSKLCMLNLPQLNTGAPEKSFYGTNVRQNRPERRNYRGSGRRLQPWVSPRFRTDRPYNLIFCVPYFAL